MVGSELESVLPGLLLETKLFVPRPQRRLVARPRLSARLSQGVQSKLTLISAPAGFGKTTLVSEWLTANPDAWSAAWLSLDHSDDELRTFWTYLIGAVQTVAPGVGRTAVSLLQSPQTPPLDVVLAMFINELSTIPNELVLVLDDYHLIDAQDIHHGMAFLVDHLPARVHLVIASRSDPPLPMARLRARGELVEIRAAHLRFQPEEVAEYLSEVMGLHVASSDVQTLQDRTEGWIAAIQLAALSMQGRQNVSRFISGFAGDDRYVVEYLVEEVLQYQPESVRRFLLETSILDRLNASLCNAVTGGIDAKAMLEALERRNLFVVSLDNRRQWYRYHQLFADVLRAYLLEDRPEQVPDLHLRASEWYERQGDMSEAIRHAAAAENFERAAALVEAVARETLRRSVPGRLVEWLQVIPDDLIRARPVLSIYYAFALLGIGELDAADGWLNSAEQRIAGGVAKPGAPLARTMVVDAEELRSAPGIVALGRAYGALSTGDVPGTIDWGRRALDLMPESDHVWRAGAAVLLSLAHWTTGDLESAEHAHDRGIASLERSGDLSLAISAAYDAAELRKARGRLSEAEKVYERALRIAEEHADSGLLGVADLHLGLSDLHCERDNLESARLHLQRAEELATQVALPQTHSRRCVVAARLRQAAGDLDGALQLLERAERLHVIGPVPETRPIAALRVRVWLAQGMLAEALNWARARGLTAEDDVSYSGQFDHITLARVLIARCEHERNRRLAGDALGLLGRLLAEADAYGRTGSVIEILIAQARAHQALGELASALVALERVLKLAEPEGYVRAFVDEGEPMRELLGRAAGAGSTFAYARRLLTAFDGAGVGHGEPPRTAAAQLLTAREAEVMRLLAIGMTNQEIAGQLVISLPTVKRHIANVYAKLGVSHRTQAVARANELRLLDARR